jgi:hypothetical protein
MADASSVYYKGAMADASSVYITYSIELDSSDYY